MKRKKCSFRILVAFMLTIILFSACSNQRTENLGIPVAIAANNSFAIRTDNGEYETTFINGVNMGVTKPGYFPGEFAIERDDYLRWFRMISEMNVNTVRVYVGQMPAFYDALLEYNSKADKPIYLFHGIYMNEEAIEKYNDAFSGDIEESFLSDIRNVVDMVHGNAYIEKLPGNAGGKYRSDISEWVIGWIPGIEWTTDFVQGTNTSHGDRTGFAGKYVRTENASPFEVFLAGAAEQAISYEMDNYGTQRPVGLCNWCTTDPLTHPNEPSPEAEDAVSVDVEHIKATDAFQAGFFASYHVYPYYPDFMSFDIRYAESTDPYLAYLSELNEYHTIPVLVSEYGIPTSRGIAHQNVVSGMTQGHADEYQQGKWLIELNKDIRESGCAGGIIFVWQDEWFKRTWNSADYENPNRRPYWLNVESPESCFGLLTFDPAEKTGAVIDGDLGEWTRRNVVTENGGILVSARYDSAYLYLMVSGEYDFNSDTLYIPLSVLDSSGNTSFDTLRFETGADYLLRLAGRENSTLLTDAYRDTFQYDYSEREVLVEKLPGQLEKDSGYFNTTYLAMNKPQYLPETEESLEFERFDTGALNFGIGDPGNDAFDSLADFCCGVGGTEIRIPWMLLGFSDPSKKEVISDFHETGSYQGVPSEGVRIGVCRSDDMNEVKMQLFTWDDWELPQVTERLKRSYYLLQEYFSDTIQEVK